MNTLFRSLVLLVSVSGAALCGAETGTIEGRIVDADSGYTLAGATVRVAETTAETVSGFDGRYVLRNVSSGPHMMVVEYLGLGRAEHLVTVRGGQTIRQDFEMGDDIVTLEKMVVEGALVGQARALNLQKSSPNLKNVVAADAIGNFPDQNAAEALSRISGVSIERDQGEGRYVTIRGIDSDLNGYALDGITLAAPRESERAVLLDIIPSDLLEQLEISKAAMPDQPADTIGGTINIKTPSAFTREGRTLQLTTQLNYADSRGTWKPHIDGMVGNVFGRNRTLGLLLAFSYDERALATDYSRPRPWGLVTDPSGGGEHYLTREGDLREYSIDRKRKGLAANFEVKASENTTYYIRGFYNEYFDSQIRNRSRIQLRSDGLVSLTDTSAVVNVGDVEEFGETELIVEFRDRVEELSLWGINLGGENRLGNLLMDYQAGYSFGDEDVPIEFTTSYVLNDVTQIAFSRAQSENPEFSYTGVGHDPSDASAYEFDETTEDIQLTEEDHWEFTFNARQDFELSTPVFLKIGMRARLKDKRAEVETFESDDHPAEISTLDLVSSEFGDFNLNRYLPVVDSTMHDYYLAHREKFAPERDFARSTARDWHSSEDVLAVYAMGGLTIGDVELFAGIRTERTQFETNGTEVDEETGIMTPIRATRTQQRWLPGVHLRYAATDRLIVRASYTETLARPGFRQSAASVTVDGDEIQTGNPDLVGLDSQNWDVSLEYYLPGSLGVLSAAGFTKDIDNFVFSRVFSTEIDGELYEISSYENGEKGKVRGLEVEYRRQLDFLPEPFDGFGLYGNVTFIDSEATLPPSIDRDDPALLTIPYPRQSDMVGNFGVTFEKGPVFARVAGTFRSEYLEDVGDDRLEDIYVQDHLQWDLATRFRIGDRWSIFANMINANDEPLSERYGESHRPARFESYSWSAQIGFKYSQ